MMKKYILGIETSCDDTSIGYISTNKKIIKHYTYNQIEHAKYKGVMPTLAARKHLEKIQEVMKRVLEDIDINEIAAIAVTVGPGLIASLMIGINYGKMLSYLLNIDFIPIHHLEGHMFSAYINLQEDIVYPYLTLLVSGGHTQYILAYEFMKYKILGGTIDDALGECFDKVGIMLGLEYPAGPQIEVLARDGSKIYKLPLPLIKEKDKCNMSFSGLKTAVMRLINKDNIIGKNIASTSLKTDLTDKEKCDIANSFQSCIAKIILEKTKVAFGILAKENIKIKNFIIAGGVSANQFISSILKELCKEYSINYINPDLKFCMDNGSMIARNGLEYFLINKRLNQNNAIARWSIENLSTN